MTMARSRLVDPSVTRWYHCPTRWVRGADLLAKVPEDRQAGIEQRLQELAQIFANFFGTLIQQFSQPDKLYDCHPKPR